MRLPGVHGLFDISVLSGIMNLSLSAIETPNHREKFATEMQRHRKRNVKIPKGL
jgi:hypothetical protein